MSKCAIDNHRIDEVFVVGQVSLANSDGNVVGSHLASALFGEVDLVE